MPNQSQRVKFVYGDVPIEGGGDVDPNAIYFSSNNKEIRIGDEMIAEEYKLQHIAQTKNRIYRGKFLGNEVTDDQGETIRLGEFKDMFLGDYWIIDDRVYEIGAFNYPGYYRLSENGRTYPESGKSLTLVGYRFNDIDGTSPILMNTERTTEGGFLGSHVYEEILPYINDNILIPTFTNSHLLTTMVVLTNAVDSTTGNITGATYTYDDISCIPDEIQAYGTRHCSVPTASTYLGRTGSGQPSQLPLYKFRYPAAYRSTDGSLKYHRNWLRDPVNGNRFAAINQYGDATKKPANDTEFTYIFDYIFAVH